MSIETAWANNVAQALEIIEAKNAEIRDLQRERNALRKACELFVEWLGREDAGSGVTYEERSTPAGEVKFMEWYLGNIDLCRASVDAAKAALAVQP